MSKVSTKNCGYYPSSLLKELNWGSTTYYYGNINDMGNITNNISSSYNKLNKLKQIPNLSPKCEKYVKMRQRRELIDISDDENININIERIRTRNKLKRRTCEMNIGPKYQAVIPTYSKIMNGPKISHKTELWDPNKLSPKKGTKLYIYIYI